MLTLSFPELLDTFRTINPVIQYFTPKSTLPASSSKKEKCNKYSYLGVKIVMLCPSSESSWRTQGPDYLYLGPNRHLPLKTTVIAWCLARFPLFQSWRQFIPSFRMTFKILFSTNRIERRLKTNTSQVCFIPSCRCIINSLAHKPSTPTIASFSPCCVVRCFLRVFMKQIPVYILY